MPIIDNNPNLNNQNANNQNANNQNANNQNANNQNANNQNANNQNANNQNANNQNANNQNANNQNVNNQNANNQRNEAIQRALSALSPALQQKLRTAGLNFAHPETLTTNNVDLTFNNVIAAERAEINRARTDARAQGPNGLAWFEQTKRDLENNIAALTNTQTQLKNILSPSSSNNKKIDSLRKKLQSLKIEEDKLLQELSTLIGQISGQMRGGISDSWWDMIIMRLHKPDKAFMELLNNWKKRYDENQAEQASVIRDLDLLGAPVQVDDTALANQRRPEDTNNLIQPLNNGGHEIEMRQPQNNNDGNEIELRQPNNPGNPQDNNNNAGQEIEIIPPQDNRNVQERDLEQVLNDDQPNQENEENFEFIMNPDNVAAPAQPANPANNNVLQNDLNRANPAPAQPMQQAAAQDLTFLQMIQQQRERLNRINELDPDEHGVVEHSRLRPPVG